MTAHRLNAFRIAVLVALALTGLRLGGCRVADLADLRALDYRLLERGREAADPRVVIVAVDDDSIARGGRWPWSRATMARLIERIAADEPRVIGADFVQSEATATCAVDAFGEQLDPACRVQVARAVGSGSSDDQKFADAVRQSQRTVLGYFFDFQDQPVPGAAPAVVPDSAAYPAARVSPAGRARIPAAPAATVNLPEISAAARGLGYFNFFPDRDGLYRRVPLAIRYGEQIEMPLSLAMLRVAFPDRPPSIVIDEDGVQSVTAAGRKIPVDPDGQMLVNYRGGGRTVQHVGAADLLGGTVPAGTFRDKLVLIGITAIGVGDVRASPFDPVFPGAEIHATVIDNILRGEFLRQPRWRGALSGAADLGGLWAVVLAVGVALQRTRGVLAALLTAAIAALYVAASQWVFLNDGLVLGTVYPLLGVALTYAASTLHHYVTIEAEKRRTRRMLDLYLSPAVADYVSDRPEMLKLGGEKSPRTVLFSDVRDFTAISEGLAPEALVELLNAYLSEMTDAVFAHDGMLDKYVGDAVMAVWGAPLPQPDHALRACRAATDMVERLASFNARGRAHGWPELRIGIGLNSGEMVFGNMGSARHLSLTVMGDHVNLGARLEGLSRIYGCPIIASEATVIAAGDEVLARELDLVQVKGKQQVVRIFEVLSANGGDQTAAEIVRLFAAGIEAYRQRRFEAALEQFEPVLAMRPHDPPALMYRERCRKLIAQPPPADWNPVTAFTAK